MDGILWSPDNAEEDDPALGEHFTSQHTIDVVIASVFDANHIDSAQLKTTLEAARRNKDPDAKPPKIHTTPYMRPPPRQSGRAEIWRMTW